MSLAQCQREVSSHEFAEWSAYMQIDPMGEARADWRMAQLTSLVYNAVRGKGKKATETKDWLPKFDDEQTRQPVEQIKAELKLIAKRHNNAREVRQRGNLNRQARDSSIG